MSEKRDYLSGAMTRKSNQKKAEVIKKLLKIFLRNQIL